MSAAKFITASQLFASAHGEVCAGRNTCFYCGGACDERFTAERYIAESFTERNDVTSPTSAFVCAGCVLSLRSDLGSVSMIDGTDKLPKADGKRKPKAGAAGNIQVRWFSWVLTPRNSLAATPAHRELLRATCLSPPEPPFAVCLADGNKHQIFRTPVNHCRERIAVNCEGIRVDYHPNDLADRFSLTMQLVATVGKCSSSLARLYDPRCDMGVVLQLANHYHDSAAVYDEWRRVRAEPLSKLAIWLTPGKEEAIDRLAAAAA